MAECHQVQVYPIITLLQRRQYSHYMPSKGGGRKVGGREGGVEEERDWWTEERHLLVFCSHSFQVFPQDSLLIRSQDSPRNSCW